MKKATLTTYPDDEGFEPEEFKKIALPQFARTLKVLRERLGGFIQQDCWTEKG